MGIRDLVTDQRTSIDDAVAASVNPASYGTTLRRLQRYNFWDDAAKPAMHEYCSHLFDYFCLQRTSDLRESIAALANAVASESPSKTRPTRLGDNQARWIRLLT